MDIIYFELNNWFRGEDYPDEEPFLSWMKNDLELKFLDRHWVKENQLCVVAKLVDMSTNFCITATRGWVENNCPKLLTDHNKFLRFPDEDGIVYGKFGTEFLCWRPDNFGIAFDYEL